MEIIISLIFPLIVILILCNIWNIAKLSKKNEEIDTLKLELVDLECKVEKITDEIKEDLKKLDEIVNPNKDFLS
jgi:hypothetical protein